MEIAVAVNLPQLRHEVSRRLIMARVSPYHSRFGAAHHVYSQCTEGNNIESNNRRSGTGGKPLCENCKEIAAGRATR